MEAANAWIFFKKAICNLVYRSVATESDYLPVTLAQEIPRKGRPVPLLFAESYLDAAAENVLDP